MDDPNLSTKGVSTEAAGDIQTLDRTTAPRRVVGGAESGTRLADFQPTRPLITATRLVHSTNRIRNFAISLLGLLVIAVVAMSFLPWQQSARGTGQVVAFRPGERQQQIQAPMAGVVESVPDALVEGAYVRKGDLLLRIEPFAADQNMQVERQIAAKEQEKEIVAGQVATYRSVVDRLEDVQERVVESADQAIEAAKSKLEQKRAQLPGYKQAVDQAQSNYIRQAGLHGEGIVPTVDLEIYKAKLEKAKAEYESAQQSVNEAAADLLGKKADREAKLEKARADIAKAESDVQTAESKIQSLDKQISDLEQKLGSLQRGDIRAPTDGFIHRLPVFPQGDAVKKGENLLTFVPVTDDYAAELLISGNDMPLVEPGDHVRLQFEGWPAIQFSGWPDMAYGTFGGEVALVDPTDDGTGKFRIMVRPAPDEEWPSAERLRQGVRVNGWVMLREVSIIFEIWRQLNGFPPLPPESMQKDAGKDAKRPTVLK